MEQASASSYLSITPSTLATSSQAVGVILPLELLSLGHGTVLLCVHLLAHEELHASPHGAEHPGDGAVVQGGLGHGLGDLGTVAPGLAHLLSPNGVGQVGGG